MPYKDKEKQLEATNAYHKAHPEEYKKSQNKSYFKRFVRDYADDTDLEWLTDLIRMKRQGVKIK